VMGNHDAAAAGMFDVDLFTDDAQAMIRWTTRRLGRDMLGLIEVMPYVLRLDCGDITALCTHGALPEPEEFNYVFGEEEASETWGACEERLVFIGHTHVPQVDILDSHDQYACPPPSDFGVEDDKRYIVNVGSIGMPRTGDTRACYCIYDAETRFVSWRRVAYDLSGLRADVEQLLRNVPGRGKILAAFDFDETTSVREQVDFTPRRSKITLRRRSRMQPKPFVQSGTVSAHRDQLPTGTLSSAVERPRTDQRKKETRIALIVAGSVAGILALIMVIGLIYVALHEPKRPPPRRRKSAARPRQADEPAGTDAALSPRPSSLSQKRVAKSGGHGRSGAPQAPPGPGAAPPRKTPPKPRATPPREPAPPPSAVALSMLKLVDFARANPDNKIAVYSRIEKIMKDAHGTEYEAVAAKLRPAYWSGGVEDLAKAVTVGESLIARGAVWHYRDDGTDPGTEWQTVEHDDTEWSSGPAQLGYGDDDETTKIGFGPDKDNKFLTAYFRHAFDVPKAGRFVNLYFRMLRDDGVVLYLNGREFARSNMPEGEITRLSVASKAISGEDEKRYLSAALGTNILAEGRNVLAVELHQHGPRSSDMSFDFELIGINREAPAP